MRDFIQKIIDSLYWVKSFTYYRCNHCDKKYQDKMIHCYGGVDCNDKDKINNYEEKEMPQL